MDTNKTEVLDCINSNEVDVKNWVYQEKIKLLYLNHNHSWLLSLLAASLLAFLSLESGEIYMGLGWWFSFVMIILLRKFNTNQFCQELKRNNNINYNNWYNKFIILTIMAGFSWGIGGIIIANNLGVLSQLYIFIVLTGVGAAAIPLLGAVRVVMLAFLIPVTVPYLIYIAYWQDEQRAVLFFIFALYALGVAVSIFRLDKNTSASLSVQFENNKMMQLLSESNQQLKKANEKLETLILEDALTGIHNRRYFELKLETEWKRESRDKRILTLMVIDIDYFKLYNDNYGHAQGDECLKSLAQLLKSALNRPSDVFARIGGEEFVVLLTDVDVEGAMSVAKKMQSLLKLAELAHVTSPINDFLTISIGIAAVVPGDDTTALGLFKAADKALYSAKAKGRDQIVIGEMEFSKTKNIENASFIDN